MRLSVKPAPSSQQPVDAPPPASTDIASAIPVLQNPPADVVAAVTAASAKAEREAEAASHEAPPPAPEPEKEPAPPLTDDVAAPSTAEAAAPAEPEATAPQGKALATRADAAPEEDASANEAAATQEAAGEQEAPPRDSQATAPQEGPVAMGGRRKARGSNTSRPVSRSTPPPPPNGAAAAMPDDTTAPTPGVRKVNKPEEPAAAKPAETGDRPSQTGADVDERFFNRRDHAEADLQPAQHDAADLEEIDPRIRRKQTPEARARRAKASRVVVGATVLCGILGLVALTRIHAKPYSTPGPVATLVIPAQPYVPVKATASAALPTGSAQEVAKADLGASPAASASGAVAEAPSGSAVAPAASSSAKLQEPIVALGQAAKAEGADPAAAAQPPIPGTGDPTEADKKEAAKEKRACQGMLEQGAFAKAIEAGERSVQLDPSDGDAWLYLGAAYQSIGKRAEARRSFLSCTTEAKKGQINECRLMLRQ